MHVISSEQFTPEMLDDIFMRADKMDKKLSTPRGQRRLAKRHIGQTLANVFYEPSTRTRASFGNAAGKLGMYVDPTENAKEYSSAIKGESLEDTIKTYASIGSSIIVLRYHETGGAERAAKVSSVPVINAGDGKGEHPSQAILDTYTIRQKMGRLDDLSLVVGGDLAHGRTARSLAKTMSLYPNNSITFVATPELAMGDDVKDLLKERGTTFYETDDVLEAVGSADVVYWTRLQKERLVKGEPAEQDPRFILGQAVLDLLPAGSIIMHPLPKITEIDPIVDNDPRAVFFNQTRNGMLTRMALIDLVLNDELQAAA